MDSIKNEFAPFEHTPVDSIPRIVDSVRDTFNTNKTKDIQWRLKQLRKFYWGMVDLAPKFQAALHKDLNMAKVEAYLTEIDFVLGDCMFAINNLEKWAKEESIPDMNLEYFFMKHRIRKEPLGVALVIGAFNFPVQLALSPVVGAIAAGCTAVLKPSESSPTVAMVMKQLFDTYMDPSAFRLINGEVAETTALLDQKWDKIVYTGSNRVAKIVAKKAAETLTPCTFELGGMNPSFVTKNADLPLAARRLMWAKVTNCGQICLSQNYVLVERSVVPGFIEALKAVYKTFFPNGAKASPDYARIVNQRQFQRIKGMLDSTKGKIVLGGETDESQLFIEPTVVQVDSKDDPLITDETFGPVFSILPYDSLDGAIKTANEVYPTPLALSTFGSAAENSQGKIYNSPFA